MPRRESGGRSRREPGQVLTEAATVISLRVVPAPTSIQIPLGPGLSKPCSFLSTKSGQRFDKLGANG